MKWVLIFFLLGNFCFAQYNIYSEPSIPWDKIVSKNGYCDLKGGKFEHNPRFDKLYSWNGKTAHVCRDNKMGIIDAITGEIIIPLKYEFIGAPDDGYFIFKSDTNSRFGVMDEQGKIIIAPKYYHLSQIHDGKLCFISDNTVGLMNLKQKILLSFPSKNASHGVLNQLGFYQKFSSLVHSYNLPVGTYMVPYEDRIIVPEFDRNKEFSVHLSDLNGNQLGEKHASILYLSDDFFAFLKDGFYGVINREGEEVLPANYQFIQLLENDDFLLKTKKGDYVLKSGVDEIKFDVNYCISLNKNRFLVQRGGNYGMLNRTMDTLLGFDFSSVQVHAANLLQVQFNRFEMGLPTGLVRTRVSYSFYYMDSLGTQLSDTLYTSYVYEFDRDYSLDIPLTILPKWQEEEKSTLFQNEKKNYRLYSRTSRLLSLSMYASKPLEGVINMNGDTLVNTKDVFFVREVNPNVFMVRNKNGDYGVMNINGELLIGFKYRYPFQIGACGILAYHEKGYDFFDFDGTIIFQMENEKYESMFFNEYGTLIYKNGIFSKNK